jgi:hypothetical protein
MVSSLYQIDLINSAGTLRLLDYEDVMSEDLKFSVEQNVSQYAPIDSRWGETSGDGAAFVSVSWERRQAHASHAAARSHVLRSAAGTAWRQNGTLRISVQSGEVWDIADASISSSSPAALVSNGFRTLTAYNATGGRMTPAAALTLAAGMRWDWTLQNWDAVTDQWQTL